MKILVYLNRRDGTEIYVRQTVNPLSRAITFMTGKFTEFSDCAEEVKAEPDFEDTVTCECEKQSPIKRAVNFVAGKINSLVNRTDGLGSDGAPKVYFTSDITPEAVLELYHALGYELPGKVAVKVHSGEPGNQNFIGPELWRPVIEEVGGTVVECNTAYGGPRGTTESHYEAMKAHGWSDAFDVEILDGDCDDLVLPVIDGKHMTENYVGGKLANYDSMLVLSHFKGHPMGGFGGALKQISIGVASSYGKKHIHGGGDAKRCWTPEADQNAFLESMAEAASSVANYFDGDILYINVMKNMSVDCDCCAVAEDPCMKDIGILASRDPIALDQACLDLVYAATDDEGQAHLLERIESRNGILTVERAAELDFGSRDYTLITL